MQEGSKKTNQKLSIKAHFLCGWPLILIVFGGFVGGALGGLAYGINLEIYKTKLPFYGKALINLFLGFLAIIIWYLIASSIRGN